LLLLVGVVASLAITLLSSGASIIFLVVLATAILHAGIGLWATILGLLLVPVPILLPERFLLTIWSVLAVVAVLERPRGLRALGRSRELVRGNGWRVFALILTLALPLTFTIDATERAASHGSSGMPLAARLLLAALVAPIPSSPPPRCTSSYATSS
jgi:hypothetical protein